MKTRRIFLTAVLIAALLLSLAGIEWLRAAQGANFDKLSDADREVLAKRFQTEIWPLLTKGEKKEDSCIGCHSTGKIVSDLRVKGDPDKDFRYMLRSGFFLKDDLGSLLGRVNETQKNRMMPPPELPRWSDAEKKILSEFVNDVHAKQNR